MYVTQEPKIPFVKATRLRMVAGMREAERRQREATFELQRLQRFGPQVEVTMPQSPNRL